MTRLPLAALAAALALAACADESRLFPTSPDAAPVASRQTTVERTAAVEWNAKTWAVVGANETRGPLWTARAFALVSVAEYDAVLAAQDGKSRGLHPSEAGAAAAAAATVLSGLYPAGASSVAAQLALDAAYLPQMPSERDADWASGLTVGRAIGASVLAYAARDGSSAVWTGTLRTGPGLWTSAPPPAVPGTPLWGQIKPWLMSSGSQFRPEPPPAFEASAEYFRDLNEVRAYSSLSPTDPVRIEQLRIARYWATGPAVGAPDYVPGWSTAGFFGGLAANLITRQNLDERRAARTYAVMYMSMMDASIACYDAKYFYQYIRPFQADPTILTPVGRPNFPSYPSAHSCLTSAALGALGGMFPPAADDLRLLIDEAGEARIVAGLHFRFDVIAGRKLGYAVAALALAPDGKNPIPLD